MAARTAQIVRGEGLRGDSMEAIRIRTRGEGLQGKEGSGLRGRAARGRMFDQLP